MKSPYDDDAPPPAYSEQSLDRKISQATALLSQTQITPNQWESYSSAPDFEDAVNGRPSAYGQQYGYRTTPVKDSARPLPYKSAPPVTPLRIVKPSEFKTNGFYVENQNSPLSPDDAAYANPGPAFGTNHYQIPLPQSGPSVSHHTMHPYPEQWSSAGEASQRSPTFDSYGAVSAPKSQYLSQPQTPRRPLPSRPSQQQQQQPHEAIHPPVFPHPSLPSHLSFDPSTAYARPAPHSNANAPYNALSLYNSAVSAQMTVPKRNRSDAQQQPISGRSHLNEFSPSRMRPDSIYSVASSRMSADDSDRFSEYSHHSSANSTYSSNSSTTDNPWYPNRR